MTKVGDKISFLQRPYQRLEDGILITPGGTMQTCWGVFGGHFGMVRCDGSIQVEDVSLDLKMEESTTYRSLVGMASRTLIGLRQRSTT